MVSDDYSCLPPEEPEWLAKMAAARACARGGGATAAAAGGRSRPGSRRNSSLGAAAGGGSGSGTPAALMRSGGGGSGGLPFPSPLRHSSTSLGVATAAPGGGGGGGEEASSGAPSPLATLERAHPEALYERFGSCEGLSAAVDDFYHRLCAEPRIGASVREVPEQDVRYLMMQLMALSLQQQQQHGEAPAAVQSEGCRSLSRDCKSLLRRAGAHPPEDFASEGEGGGADAVYAGVMGAMMATLEALGVSRAHMEARRGAGGGADADADWLAWRAGGGGDGSAAEGSEPAAASGKGPGAAGAEGAR